jgi:uncharacterized protein
MARGCGESQSPLAPATWDLWRMIGVAGPLPPDRRRRNDRFMTSVQAATAHTGSGVVEAAEIHETHTGVVFLVGDRAFKVKKAVVTDFLDFSTVQRREEACEREVRLNGRIAPESYLGVAHLTDPAGGEPEPVVVMRRYPDSIRLASMVRCGRPVEEHLTALADRIARFHAEAVRGGPVDACAQVSAIRTRWSDNLKELRKHVGTVFTPELVAEADHLAMQFVDGRAALFAGRIEDRRVVDGHGDLMADDVFCLPDGPVPLDCLEFDDQLRFVDGLDDAAFLAMDLEFLGSRGLAEFFLDEYRRFAGDPAPASLAHFFIAYRAVVRAKVDCIRLGQGHDGAAADARRHLEFALGHLRAGTVRLILVGGGPGTGKTTLARALSEELGAQVISSDDVRRGMRVDGDLDGEPGVYDSGLYGPDGVEAVYTAMLLRAGPILDGGTSVILDGTWRDPRQRARARDLASQHHSPAVELRCVVPLEEAMARIRNRPSSTSDATPQIASDIARDHPVWAGAHHIDTTSGRPLGNSVAEAHEVCCLAI